MKQQPKKKKRQQPAPRLGFALINVEVSYWGIDPDIARNAIEARIKQKLKERPGEITPAKIEKIGEDFVLASLANIPPEKWPDDFAQLIKEREEKSPGFWEKLKRGRTSEFSPGDIFMCSHWPKLKLTGLVPAFDKVRGRGLREWHPRAAMELMRRCNLYVGSSEKWYEDRRLNLGLTPAKQYFVLDAGTHLPDAHGQWAFKTRDA